MKIAFAFFEQFIGISGGIEHVCCNLANALSRRGHEISIIYCYGHSGNAFYPLDKEVKLYNLMTMHPEKWKRPALGKCVSGSDRAVREILRIFSKSAAREWNESAKGRMIRTEIRDVLAEVEPDIILSYRYETSNYLLNFAQTQIPVVTMFHMTPDTVLPDAPKGELLAIEKSACAQVLMKGDIEKVKKHCPRATVEWIPNAVPQYEEKADLKALKSAYKIINAARLNKAQKRQHLLVEAFSMLAEDFPEWTVELWGGGDDTQYAYAEELRQLIHHKNLDDRVFLKGESTHILDEYLKADIFCFPSAYEGFGLSMAEAMSAGIPAVAFRSCAAVSELIQDGQTGVLANDGADHLAAALKELMQDQERRATMGEKARESMKEYAPERIWDMWEDLLKRYAVQGRK